MRSRAIFNTLKSAGMKHGATVLTVLAALGVVATAVLTNEARPKADDLVNHAKEDKAMRIAEEKHENPDFDHVELTRFEKIKAAAPAYVKVFIVGGLTILFVVGSRVISIKQMGDLAAAYNIIQTVEERTAKYSEKFEQKAKEIMGDEKVEAIKADVNKEISEEIAYRVSEDPDLEAQIARAIHTGRGNQLIYDSLIGRFFYGDPLVIKDEATDINLNSVGNYNKISLNEFYDAIMLPEVDLGDELYWTIEDRRTKIAPEFSPAQELLDGRFSYIVMTFARNPQGEYR